MRQIAPQGRIGRRHVRGRTRPGRCITQGQRAVLRLSMETDLAHRRRQRRIASRTEHQCPRPGPGQPRQALAGMRMPGWRGGIEAGRIRMQVEQVYRRFQPGQLFFQCTPDQSQRDAAFIEQEAVRARQGQRPCSAQGLCISQIFMEDIGGRRMRQDRNVVQMCGALPLRALAGEGMPGGEEGLTQPEMQVQHGGAALFAQAVRNALQCGGNRAGLGTPGGQQFGRGKLKRTRRHREKPCG